MRISLFPVDSSVKEKCEFCVESPLARNFFRRVIVDDSGLASTLLIIHELPFLGLSDSELTPILSFICRLRSRLLIVTID